MRVLEVTMWGRTGTVDDDPYDDHSLRSLAKQPLEPSPRSRANSTTALESSH